MFQGSAMVTNLTGKPVKGEDFFDRDDIVRVDAQRDAALKRADRSDPVDRGASRPAVLRARHPAEHQHGRSENVREFTGRRIPGPAHSTGFLQDRDSGIDRAGNHQLLAASGAKGGSVGGLSRRVSLSLSRLVFVAEHLADSGSGRDDSTFRISIMVVNILY